VKSWLAALNASDNFKTNIQKLATIAVLGLSLTSLSLFTFATPSHSADGLLSSYCDGVRDALRRKCENNADFSEPIIVNFTIDPIGTIHDVEPLTTANAAQKAAARNALGSVGKIDAPPANSVSPFRVRAQLSSSPQSTTVGLADPQRFDNYLSDVRSKIMANWFPPHGPQYSGGVGSLRIWRDGHVSNVSLKQTTGDSTTDASEVAAMESTKSLPPLPDGSAEYIDFEMPFRFGTPISTAKRDDNPIMSAILPNPVTPSSYPLAMTLVTGPVMHPLITATQFDSPLYFAKMRHKILAAWFPPLGIVPAREVTVVFQVSSTGEVSDLRLESGSGNAFRDSASLQAVKAASPFDPLPAGAASKVPFQIKF
jgi:TonB family protein